jgi:hypothetical protein
MDFARGLSTRVHRAHTTTTTVPIRQPVSHPAGSRRAEARTTTSPPPLLPRHMRRGSGSALICPSAFCDASATMSLVAPAGWRRDGRVPLLRVHDPPGSRRAVVVPPRGPSPATSARLLRRCLVPSAGFYSVSEHSPPRADLDYASDSAARGDRRPLLLVWIE